MMWIIKRDGCQRSAGHPAVQWRRAECRLLHCRCPGNARDPAQICRAQMTSSKDESAHASLSCRTFAGACSNKWYCRNNNLLICMCLVVLISKSVAKNFASSYSVGAKLEFGFFKSGRRRSISRHVVTGT